jgi:hypothetical protein
VGHAKAAPQGEATVDTSEAAVSGPAMVVGMNENEVQQLLGPPTHIGPMPPGKEWEYRNGDCVLTVALYPDVETRVFHALSYEVTSHDQSTHGNRRCWTHFNSIAGR